MMKTINDLQYLLNEVERTGAANWVDPINWSRFGPILVGLAEAAERLRDSEERLDAQVSMDASMKGRRKAIQDIRYFLDRLEEMDVYPPYTPYGLPRRDPMG